jgi:hypothetical protein
MRLKRMERGRWRRKIDKKKENEDRLRKEEEELGGD